MPIIDDPFPAPANWAWVTAEIAETPHYIAKFDSVHSLSTLASKRPKSLATAVRATDHQRERVHERDHKPWNSDPLFSCFIYLNGTESKSSSRLVNPNISHSEQLCSPLIYLTGTESKSFSRLRLRNTIHLGPRHNLLATAVTLILRLICLPVRTVMTSCPLCCWSWRADLQRRVITRAL